jgi:hypothetical protein
VPRLTNQQYINRHEELRAIWLSHPEVLRSLSPGEQLHLHAYYRTAEQLTKAELIHSRKRLDRDDPALGHLAGKAYAHFQRDPAPIIDPQHPRTTARMVSATRGHISVSAIMRPEPDLRKLANALLWMAEAQRIHEAGSPRPPSADSD